jgi:hypothetical protein
MAKSKRNTKRLPKLTEEQILQWAHEYFRRTGNWPTKTSGSIPGVRGETWMKIGACLDQGHRGLPRSSLAQLLAKHGYRRRPNARRPPLTIEKILEWADAYRRRTGKLPEPHSGRVIGARGETWMALDASLNQGHRELEGGSSLRKVLARYRGRKYRVKCPDVTEVQIAKWAKRHYRETGEWPLRRSGPVRGGLPDDTWLRLDAALSSGARSLPGGSSLPRLLFEFFGVQRRSDLYRKKADRGRTPREGSWFDPFAPRPEALPPKKTKKQNAKTTKRKRR